MTRAIYAILAVISTGALGLYAGWAFALGADPHRATEAFWLWWTVPGIALFGLAMWREALL